MRIVLLKAICLFSLSTHAFAGSCVDSYKQVVNDNKRSPRENAGNAMLLGALSSTVAIVSFGTGGPGLMLTGLSSFAASGYIAGTAKEKREEAQAVLNLIKDAKIKTGYYLRDATMMIQNHFQDPSISEEEVADHILKLDESMSYCSGTKLQGLSGVLMSVGKSVIIGHAKSTGISINDKQRNNVEKISIPASAPNSLPSTTIGR